jgi:hypothetical protein
MSNPPPPIDLTSDVPERIAEVLSPYDTPDNPLWASFPDPGSESEILRIVRPDYSASEAFHLTPYFDDADPKFSINDYRPNTGYAYLAFKPEPGSESEKNLERFRALEKAHTILEFGSVGSELSKELLWLDGLNIDVETSHQFKNTVNMREERRIQRVRRTLFDALFQASMNLPYPVISKYEELQRRVIHILESLHGERIKELTMQIQDPRNYSNDESVSPYLNAEREAAKALEESLKGLHQAALDARKKEMQTPGGDLHELPGFFKRKLLADKMKTPICLVKGSLDDSRKNNITKPTEQVLAYLRNK